MDSQLRPLMLICVLLVIQKSRGSESAEAALEIAASRDPNAVNPSAENFYLNPYALQNISSMDLQTYSEKKKLMQNEFVQYLADQISLSNEEEALPGQRVCLPLILRSKLDRIPANFDYHTFLFKTVKEITAGTFVQNVILKRKRVVPAPTYHKVVNYNSDKDYFIDMGPDYTLSDKSFTISATIRLRGSSSRGARVLSMRDSTHDGWEFVVPSYYGRQVSFYASATPGHVDYGQAYIPEDVWSVVGIVVDRETYPGGIAKVTSYVDGVKDGESTLINFDGVRLSSRSNLTVGILRQEDGSVAKARIDYREPKEDWKRYSHQFFGDIKEFSIWHTALTRHQMRRHAVPQLRKLRPQKMKTACPMGFKALNCTCYKVFNQLASFEDANKVCKSYMGTLAMPKNDHIQTFLEVLMQRYGARTFWIGLHDMKVENEYEWNDGSVFQWRTDFHRFALGKPDKTYKVQDCFEEEKARHEFIWNDEHCLKLNAFICETSDLLCEVNHPENPDSE